METAPDMIKIFLKERDPKSWTEGLNLAKNYKEAHVQKHEMGSPNFQRDNIRNVRGSDGKKWPSNHRKTDRRGDRRVPPSPNRVEEKKTDNRANKNSLFM